MGNAEQAKFELAAVVFPFLEKQHPTNTWEKISVSYPKPIYNCTRNGAKVPWDVCPQDRELIKNAFEYYFIKKGERTQTEVVLYNNGKRDIIP